MYSTDPVQQGFVKSLARPETNLTGLSSFPDAELQGKRLEVFKEVVPTLQRVVVLYNARVDAPHHTMSLEVVRKASPSLGLKLIEKPIRAPAEVEPALSTVSKDNAGGIFMICSGLFRDVHSRIGASALKKKIPLMGCFEPMRAEYGGLVEYDTDRYRIGHRGAWYVDRILKGARPQDLPVETPTKFELVINLKTAKQIGLTIPPNVLARADKVIK
jgi:putative ABC transport system substrate-binding protein